MAKNVTQRTNIMRLTKCASSYGMSSVCDLGPAKVKSRLTSVCTSGISKPTLQWGLISIMSLHLQSQNRPPNTKLLKPYTSVCITMVVVAV